MTKNIVDEAISNNISFENKKPTNLMTTEDIKTELGSSFEKMYDKYNTGEKNWNCELFYGERQGIIDMLLKEKIINFTTRNNKNDKNETIVTTYWTIRNVERYKKFSRMLDLLRELKYRRIKAKKYNQESLNFINGSKISK